MCLFSSPGDPGTCPLCPTWGCRDGGSLGLPPASSPHTQHQRAPSQQRGARGLGYPRGGGASTGPSFPRDREKGLAWRDLTPGWFPGEVLSIIGKGQRRCLRQGPHCPPSLASEPKCLGVLTIPGLWVQPSVSACGDTVVSCWCCG